MLYYLFVFYLLMMSVLIFITSLYLYMNKLMFFFEFELIKISSVKIEVLLYFDWMGLMFMSVVFLISSMVVLYSIEYMKGDKFTKRFMMLVMLFVLSMVLLILSLNMISILLGWDGLGLVSYCLVIYYQNESSYKSGMVTILINRLGDIFILILIGLMVYLGSFNIMFIFLDNNFNIYLMLILFLAAITKSAQMPFSSWLPLAMAAPTPVSSLVHSSTLVTAGVYLLMRFNYLMVNNFMLNFIMIISLLTMFMAGICANFEFDLKKIIALSTLSQLGVMIFSLSLKLVKICFFHLIMHALFKSMLFMCVGVIIHLMMGWQDIRKISMIFYYMPIVSIIFNCGNLSLCGIFFLSGFYSKDLILEMYMMNYMNKSIFILLFISMGLTVGYTMRLLYYSFFKFNQLNMFIVIKEIKSIMVLSMMILYFFTILMGSSISWLLFPMGDMIYLSKSFKILVNFFILLGVIISLLTYKMKLNLFKWYNFMSFNMNMWYLSLTYSFSLVYLFKYFNKMNYNNEIGWSESNFKSCTNLLLNIFNIDLVLKNFYMNILFMLNILFLIFLFI